MNHRSTPLRAGSGHEGSQRYWTRRSFGDYLARHPELADEELGVLKDASNTLEKLVVQ